MTQARSKRLLFSLLTSAMVLAWSSQLSAEVIVFANGRTMSVKDYRVNGDTITVTLRQGGEATFDRALVARIAPDEVPVPDEPAAALTDTAAVIAPAARRQPLESRPFAALIETVALKHGIDPALVHAVVQAESNYRPGAKSHVGARGLMQVMPATGRDLGVKSASLFDPQQNLEAGVKYLKFLLERFDGDLPTAIAAYNAGPGAVSRHAGIPPYPETQNYVRKVLSNFQQ
jgi:soluble lytic murein transglycosylase-like protein